ncbi:integrase catalytic domain-containing protein [Trichonephila clavipes]|nr:integrase catalytic domain-containing protein [Trichonephila clavipes]
MPRFLFVDSDNQLHLYGFSDASEKAYAAAIYCRSVSDTGKINIQLIIAKTRVAPLKPVSLPRLELCGALLLVKLMVFTCKALNYPIQGCLCSGDFELRYPEIPGIVVQKEVGIIMNYLF